MQLSLLLSLLPLAAATPGYSYGGSDSSSSGSGSGTAAAAQSGTASAANGVQTITVGRNPLKMEPADVVVPAGNIIEFHFYSGAHSVAQSAFDSPCQPLNATGGGFFSGSQAVQSGTGANVFRVVSTGQPMWYYCATARHCQGGMVGVINKPANNAARTLEAYTTAARAAPANVAPANVQGGTIAAMGSAVTTGTSSGNGAQSTNGASSAVSDMRLVGAVVGLAAVAFAL
jgi:plastocyanin